MTVTPEYLRAIRERWAKFHSTRVIPPMYQMIIETAPADIHALLAEVERLTAQVAALEAERDVMFETILGKMITIDKQLLQHVAALTRERDEARAALEEVKNEFAASMGYGSISAALDGAKPNV